MLVAGGGLKDGFIKINSSLEYISDYLLIQESPSTDAGTSCILPGWQIMQRSRHLS